MQGHGKSCFDGEFSEESRHELENETYSIFKIENHILGYKNHFPPEI